VEEDVIERKRKALIVNDTGASDSWKRQRTRDDEEIRIDECSASSLQELGSVRFKGLVYWDAFIGTWN
jgi:hypothetical protein